MKPGTAYDTQDSSGELSGSIFKTGVACAHTWYGLAGDAPDNTLRSNNIISFSTLILNQPLRHCELVPLVIKGRTIGESPPGRPRVGTLDRVKDGGPFVAVKRRALN